MEVLNLSPLSHHVPPSHQYPPTIIPMNILGDILWHAMDKHDIYIYIYIYKRGCKYHFANFTTQGIPGVVPSAPTQGHLINSI